MARTVGVRFRQAGKIFYYDAGDLDLPVSSYVIVESSHGAALGRVVIAPDQVIENQGSAEDLKPVLRLATPEDVEQAERMEAKAKEAVRLAKERAGDLGLGISVSTGEFDLDGTQFTAYFTSNDRVDFRNLVRDLSRDLDARVQLLQVGDRDRAKLVDGFDICGERLCCSSWMTNFPAVSIRMAKEQDLPLNPQKISGVCGRLYCCLTFEYEDYKALRGTLPKVGSMISTPAGEAKVTGIDFNREVVKLTLTEGRIPVEVAAIDFKLQNGVAIRPMELVRKIEGPLRPIGEDSSAVPSRVDRPRRAGRSTPPERPAGERSGGGQRGNRRNNAGSGPTAERPSPEAPAGDRAGRNRNRPARPNAQRPAQPPPASTPPPNAPAGEAGEATRRRRRRRRGRGRGQGGGEAPPAPDAS